MNSTRQSAVVSRRRGRFAANAARAALAALAVCAVSPTGAGAVKVKSKADEIRISGRIHVQFNTSSVEGEPGAEFLLRRARFSVEAKLGDFVSGTVEPEYGLGDVELKNAFIQFDPGDSFSFRAGQFKRPFDLFQLTSSNRSHVIEREAVIRGAEGLPSYSSLSEGLQFSDRDIGVDGRYRSGDRKVTASFMVGNGLGPNRAPGGEGDPRGGLQSAGRIEVRPMEDRDLTLAGNASFHPYRATATTSSRVEFLEEPQGASGSPVLAILSQSSDEYAFAAGFDAEFGGDDHGFHGKAGFLHGENWEADAIASPETTFTDSTRTIRAVSRENAADPPRFTAAQVIVSYRKAVGENGPFEAVEPLLRLGYADPNDDVADDGGYQITPGVQLFFTGRSKISFNLDIFVPEAEGESAEHSFKAQTYLFF